MLQINQGMTMKGWMMFTSGWLIFSLYKGPSFASSQGNEITGLEKDLTCA